MGAEDFDYAFFPLGRLDTRTSDPFAHVPVAAKESRRSTIQGVADHIGFEDWPFG